MMPKPCEIKPMNSNYISSKHLFQSENDCLSNVLDIVFSGGYLRWFEIEPLVVISKNWNESIQKCKEILPDWNEIISFLNTVNTCNRCKCGNNLTDCRNTSCAQFVERLRYNLSRGTYASSLMPNDNNIEESYERGSFNMLLKDYYNKQETKLTSRKNVAKSSSFGSQKVDRSEYLPLVDDCNLSKTDMSGLDVHDDCQSFRSVGRSKIIENAQNRFYETKKFANYSMQLFGHNFDDPRNSTHYRALSPYQKAVSLLKFHQKCIRDITSFFPEDWTERPPLWHADVEWGIFEEVERISLLQESNEPVYNLLSNIVELMMARMDLSHKSGPQMFRDTFLGCRINDGFLQDIENICTEHSNLKENATFQILQKGRVVCPLTNAFSNGNWDNFVQNLMYSYNWIFHLMPDPLGGPAASWARDRRLSADYVCSESFSDRQFCLLGNSIWRVLMMRDIWADELFGPVLANSLDILHGARQSVLPRLRNIIPLEHLPPVNFAYFPERLNIAKSIVFNLYDCCPLKRPLKRKRKIAEDTTK